MAKNGVTLKDIAKQYQSLAQLYVQTPPTRAVDTGTLRDSIKVIQTRTNKAGGIIFDLKTVYYGFFVEYGTRKMKPRPFGQRAADSDTLKAMIDDYFKSEVEITLMETMKVMDKKLKPYLK